MGMEREIKLALPVSQVNAATQWFVARTGHKGRPIELANIYFDTPNLVLANSKSALRLRHTPDGWLQTFKTVGNAKDGLHSRHEWEMPVAGEKLEIDALLRQCDEPTAAEALRQAAPELIELFRTNFTRTLWNVERRRRDRPGRRYRRGKRRDPPRADFRSRTGTERRR
jgi:triphosphatase